MGASMSGTWSWLWRSALPVVLIGAFLCCALLGLFFILTCGTDSSRERYSQNGEEDDEDPPEKVSKKRGLKLDHENGKATDHAEPTEAHREEASEFVPLLFGAPPALRIQGPPLHGPGSGGTLPRFVSFAPQPVARVVQVVTRHMVSPTVHNPGAFRQVAVAGDRGAYQSVATSENAQMTTVYHGVGGVHQVQQAEVYASPPTSPRATSPMEAQW